MKAKTDQLLSIINNAEALRIDGDYVSNKIATSLTGNHEALTVIYTDNSGAEIVLNFTEESLDNVELLAHGSICLKDTFDDEICIALYIVKPFEL